MSAASTHGDAPRTLTARQEQAAQRRAGSLLLAAGAGSGKTSVLVERFARAVCEDGVAAGRILAITFTDRAAAELRERICARLRHVGDMDAAREAEGGFVSTFHGFCTRLIREHTLLAGVDPQFSILDDGLARRARERAFSLALGDLMSGAGDAAVDLLAAYGVERVRAMTFSVYGALRSRGVRRPRLPDPGRRPEASAESLAACALLAELLAAFDARYQQLKDARGELDFDDLELCARDLLVAHRGVRVTWSERFEMLMVDEFQDTNQRQLEILDALDRDNLFVVGDELQSIYGFRHADVGLFRRRRAELGGLELAENFRSLPSLLAAVNAAFAVRFDEHHAPLVAVREEPGAPDRAGESRPRVELLLTARRGWEQAGSAADCWRRAEADALAERVAQLIAEGETRPGDVAVLMRSLSDLDVFERALHRHGLSTLATVGGFWARWEVGHLLAYLRALANPLDELALYSTLASPLVGCSPDALSFLAEASRARGRGRLWETICAAEQEVALWEGDRERLEALRLRLGRERVALGRRSLCELIADIVAASGYREYLLGLDWGEMRWSNVQKLLRLAARFEEREGRDLRAFLDYASALQNDPAATEPDAPPLDPAGPDAVRLMSMHAAKGLEFPVVCVADLGRTQNLDVPDLLVDGDRVGLRLARLDGAPSHPALDFEELACERRRAQAQEEDRVLYVAMTRARDRLLLSGAIDFDRWPDPREGAPPIVWLGPALVPDLPELVKLAPGPSRELLLTVGSSSPGAGASLLSCRLNSPASPDSARTAASPESARGAASPDSAYAAASAPTPGAAPTSGTAPNPEAEPKPGPATQAARAGDLDPLELIGSLSYTRLSELERCGYRYYAEHVLGLPELEPAGVERPARGALEARARGTLAHRLLELVDFVRPMAPDPVRVKEVAEQLGLRVFAKDCEELSELVGRALTASPSAPAHSGLSPAARAAACELTHREYPFAFVPSPGEPLITGVIDLLARELDGGALVIDYKTDSVSHEVDLYELVERDYGLQRLIYALAVLRDGAPHVEVVHWFLQRPREWVGVRYDAVARQSLEAILAQRLLAVRASAFAVSEQPHRGLCLTCPARAALCSWGEAETLREHPGAQLSDRSVAGAGARRV